MSMRLVTENISNINIETLMCGDEVITVESAHGKVEITIPKFGTQKAHMTTQVFQAISEVTMATVETSVDAYFDKDFPNTHNTEVIK